MLFRCRNVIEQVKIGYQIVAEEMLLRGCRAIPQQKEFLDHDVAKKLLNAAVALAKHLSQSLLFKGNDIAVDR